MAVFQGNTDPTKPLTTLDSYVPLGNSGLRVSPLCLVSTCIFIDSLQNNPEVLMIPI